MRSAGQSRLPVKWWPNQHNIPCQALFRSALSGYSDWGFSVIFPQLWSKCKDTIQRQDMAYPPPSSTRHSFRNKVSVHRQWLPSCDYATLGLKPQQPPKYDLHPLPPSKKKLCSSWALVFSMPKWGLQPRQEIVSVSAFPSYSIGCVLLLSAMQSNTGMAEEIKGCLHP